MTDVEINLTEYGIPETRCVSSANLATAIGDARTFVKGLDGEQKANLRQYALRNLNTEDAIWLGFYGVLEAIKEQDRKKPPSPFYRFRLRKLYR